MIKNYLLTFAFILSVVAVQAQLAGTTWKMKPAAGALAVGPTQGAADWWSNDDDAVTTRACYFDDVYVFNADGSFTNQLDADTWLETWQGTAEGCGAPVAPHDGSATATWAYDATAGTVTITGTGAYLGLPKVHNTGELAAPGDAVASITYLVSFAVGDSAMTIDINYGPSDSEGWWRYEMTRESTTSTDVVLNQNAFEVFPNPAVDQFTINFDEAISTSANLSIYDLQGKLVKQEIITNQQTVVATDDLKTGLYIIRVDSEAKSYVHKLSIVK
ncbi:MAG: T9SS type A sorting domain-containing protein [Saprospiraceae bacterium]